MENVKNLDKAISLIVAAHTIKGTAFVGLRDYVNKQEIVLDKLSKKYPQPLLDKAYFELYESLEKRLSSPEIKEELRKQNDSTIARSDAQIDAYIHITKGVKIHKETELLHVFGLVVKKTVLEAIAYKNVASRDLTLCKNEIQKLCEFKGLKYRNFIFNKSEVKIQGFTI